MRRMNSVCAAPSAWTTYELPMRQMTFDEEGDVTLPL